jgi:2-aminoethylphosphonate-pyruvate transaminase
MMLVDLVVLDIAGTTVHDGDAVHRCLAGAIGEAGVTPSRDAINRVMGMPKPYAIATLLERARGVPPDAAEVERLYQAFERRMLDHYRSGSTVHEADGATDVMRRLRAAGAKVALDTGFARPITDAVLARLGWSADLVDLTVSSDEVPRGRPHPDMVQRAMAVAGVADPARVAKVGDTPADLLEGTAAGCGFVIGVTTGSHTRAELEVHPHTHLIGSLRELLPLVDGGSVTRERAPGDRSTPLLFTPGPLTTSSAVKAAMLRDLGSRDREFIDLVARVRTRLLDVVDASTARGFEAVLVQGSGTYAVEAMLGTFVPPGARLLVLDNGAYGARMADIARTLGLDPIVLTRSPVAPISASEVGEALVRHAPITHVTVVHCETTTGVLNPIADLGALVSRAGGTFLVDAMSSFGAIPIDVERDHIAVLASSANKCLEGVPGCAFVVARRDLLTSASTPRSVALDLAAQWRGFERDGQFRFTPPTHVTLALDRALTELDAEGGVAGRGARYRANHERLVAGMRALGFKEVVAPRFQSNIITAFFCPSHPAFQFDAFYERLRARNFVIYPGKVAGIDSFRIGSIGRLYPEDMDALVDGIRDVLADMGVRV